MSGNNSLTSNVVNKDKKIIISYKELQKKYKDVLLKIENNILAECNESEDYIKGYNLSLRDIESNLKNTTLPTKDISSEDDEYLDVLEILYKIDSLNKSVDTTVSTFKTIEKVSNGK